MSSKNQYTPETVTHPGMDLAEKLEELGMGPKELGIRMDKAEKEVIAMLKGERAITPESALRLEQVLRIPAHYWLKRQQTFDEAEARIARQELLAQAVVWMRKFPMASMVKLGWIPSESHGTEKALRLLEFFQLSSPNAWKQTYCDQQMKLAFRISLANTKEPFAISAWLRQGELLAQQTVVPQYDSTELKAALPKLKAIMAAHPVDFMTQLQDTCAKAGVIVVYTPTLPKAPIGGCARWIKDNPLIQLSDRQKRNDVFWFNVFHELGHVLEHGKKDIFLENIEYSEADAKKESEANAFAVKWTLTEPEEHEVSRDKPLSKTKVREYAERFGTHPGVIVGRLQRSGVLRKDVMTELFKSVRIQ